MSAYELWFSQPAVAKYMFWGIHSDIDETEEWLRFELKQRSKPYWYRFAVEYTSTKQLIGSVLLYYEKDICGWEIAYHFAQAYWGQGYATEAVMRIIAFARETLHIDCIAARYAIENSASEHVLKKAGFQPEANILYVCNDGRVVLPGILCRLQFNIET